jgi:hypothetical protein
LSLTGELRLRSLAPVADTSFAGQENQAAAALLRRSKVLIERARLSVSPDEVRRGHG